MKEQWLRDSVHGVFFPLYSVEHAVQLTMPRYSACSCRFASLVFVVLVLA